MEIYIHCFIILVGFFEIQVQAQLGETSRQSTSMTSFQQLDRTVVDSVLKIVDDKFDSLSERISSLERAVNGLQYYNVRQFKVVNTNLNTVDKTLQFMNSQVGLMDVENKGLKISMDLVKRDIKSMEKVNNMMFEAMEQNFDYLNKGFSERLENLQSMVSVINQSSDEISKKMQESFSNLPPIESNCSHILEKIEDKINIVINNSLKSLHNTTTGSNDLKTLTHTLSGLNSNLKRSITYYHHTGDLVERIVGATETVAEDQMIIREDLREFLEKQTNISACNTPYKDNIVKSASKIPLNMRNTVQSEKLSQCEIPISAITEFKHVLKNGSQLVELVTDLAQTSQISLKTTVVELLKEVHRMKENQKTSQNNKQHSVPPLSNGFIEYDFEMLLNATKGVLQMAEAIASHTRWIPYIFHNLQFVEGQINNTLSSSKHMQMILNQLVRDENSTEHDKPSILMGNLTTAINYIYHSTVKLQRLTPSLTRLLGEPGKIIIILNCIRVG